MSSTKKKPISQKNADREKSENRTLNRVYYVFLLGLIAECYLFFIYRGYAWGTVGSVLAWDKFLRAAIWVGLAALVIGAIAAILKRKDKKLRTISTWVASVGGFFFLSSWVCTHFFNGGLGVTAMCILVPIVAVLALIYLLYQHECAFSTVILGGALFSAWLRGASAASERWRVPVIIGCAVVVVALLAALYLADKARKSEGKLFGFRVFSVECDYRIVYAVLAAAAVAVLLAACAASITYYIMWVLGILLFAELVYYTTKLM